MLTHTPRFSEIAHQPTNSAPVIQHPTLPDVPAFRVHAGADGATEKVLSVPEVTALFLRTLLQSAQQFLGRAPSGAVLSCPPSFTPPQKAALRQAAQDAGVPVLALLEDAGAVAVAAAAATPARDHTLLVVDLGQTALELALLSVRHGLAHALGATTTPAVCGRQLDDALLAFFAKDFAKKTKTALVLPIAPEKASAADKGDVRAEARLRLALEHTRKTVSASAGAAACAVESLKDGLDYAGSVNRLRFDVEARPVYAALVSAVKALLAEAGSDGELVDAVAFAGGAGCLPGLRDAVLAALGEDAEVLPGEPTETLALGCALQADLLARLAGDADADLLRGAADAEGREEPVLARTIGVLFPGAGADEEMGGLWVPLVRAETALPCRRTAALAVPAGRVALEAWEASESVTVTTETLPAEDDDDEPEESEVRTRAVAKEACLGALELDAKGGPLRVQVVVSREGKVELSAWEEGGERKKVVLG
jgi:heat shock protein 1/8